MGSGVGVTTGCTGAGPAVLTNQPRTSLDLVVRSVPPALGPGRSEASCFEFHIHRAA
jgi:hypothetical protein